MKVKKTKIIIIGLGVIGKKHLEAIDKVDNAELVAVVDVNKKVLNYLDDNVSFYNSIDELFNNEKVDGAIVSTPNNSHYKDVLNVIKYDCPVLVEKPITTNSNDTLELINVSKKKNIDILVGHHRRHNPIIKKAFDLINNNEIGKLRTVHISCQMYKPSRYFKNKSWSKNEGAGPIIVNLIHDLDLMNYLLGDIKSVFCNIKSSIRGFENEDLANASIEFENGVLGTILLSDSVASPWSWELTSRENERYPYTGETCYFLGGTNGSIALPNLTIWKYRNEPDWLNPIFAKKIPLEFSDPLVNQIKHFVEVINKTTPPIITAEIANKSIKVIEAMKLSAKTNKLVEIKN